MSILEVSDRRVGTPFDQFAKQLSRPAVVAPVVKLPVVHARKRRAAKPVAPARSVAQRQEALRRANRIRSGRSQLKRDLKAGRVSVVAILADPPGWSRTMKVQDLLLAVPKFGPVKVAKIHKRTAISHAKTLEGLSPRQRAELIALLEGQR